MTFVTTACAVANLLMAVIKILAGIYGKSAAMMADAVHSLSDVVADAVVLIMVRISAKGTDERHNWGRGKYETIATLAISILLLFIAADMMKDGIETIREILIGGDIETPSRITLWVAVISIVLQETIFRWNIHVGKAVDSQTMIANAWHHRSDALASVAALIGIGGAIFIGGKWVMLDPLVGCIISIVILIIAVRMLLPALHELTDGALPKEDIAKISDIIRSATDKAALKSLRTRKSGHINIIDATVSVRADMSIAGSTDITEQIKSALRQEFSADDTQISVVVEPD
ncbi:MAG: cation diffusion facilitator family transporter [Bacteroidaceae bacterium]|nr:cation diffusion facilitator family transporter [Bacteroidaceae bacterium]